MSEQIVIQIKIRSHLEALQRKNPAFSLRALARKLHLSPSALSEIINGKRKISKKMAERLIERMCLDPLEAAEIRQQFSLGGVNSELALTTNSKPGRLSQYKKQIEFLKLNSDQFSLISEWSHFALLSLMETINFVSDASWMAQRLALTVTETQKVLNRLLDLKLITKKNKNYQPTGKALLTSDDVANQAVRKAHYEDLKLAEKVLDQCPVELRDFTAITLAVDSNKLPEAKKMIREFQDALTQFLEDGNKDEVYKMTFYLYPLSHKNTKETP